MPTDTERLDWLIDNIFDNHWNGTLGEGSRTTYMAKRGPLTSLTGKDFRDAVDRRMEIDSAD
jgi:hypothetical protein